MPPCGGRKNYNSSNSNAFPFLEDDSAVLDDNCCGCNVASYSHMCNMPDCTLLYIDYHVDVGETPFLVAVDYARRAIVVCIRGTLSFKVRFSLLVIGGDKERFS